MHDAPTIDPSFALSGEERAILTHLSAHRPALVQAFLAHVPDGRRGIARRLLQALVREQLVEPERVRFEATARLVVTLDGRQRIEARLARRLSLGRFDLEGPIVHHSPGRSAVIDAPEHLLALFRPILRQACDAPSFARFSRELENSAANYALALAGASERRASLAAEALALGTRDALSFASARQAHDATFSPLAFFEQWVVDGHPLHPGAKIKLGLTPAEVIAHSPEWGAEPLVRLVAVEKASCRVTTARGRTPSELLAAEWPEHVQAAERELAERGLAPAAYELIPVHPWQHDRKLPSMYAEALASGAIVTLDVPALPTRALMSFRSLAPIQHRGEGKHHLKTCVDVQLTGAVRIITPQSIHNGPALSALLGEIQACEGGFDGRFVVLEEEAGICYVDRNPALTEQARHASSKSLAALFRENPEDHVGPGEIALAGSSLIARSPISARPVVVEAIEAFARAEGHLDPEAAAIAFVRRYAEIALPGFLTLMSRYGVSMEGHLQNSVVVLKDGAPVRLVVRDLGGVRVLLERLERRGLTVAFHPESATVTRDVEALRNKLSYPVFQNHLGEVIAAIHRALGPREEALWTQVAEVGRSVYSSLKQDPAIAEQAASDEAALFAPTVALKAMATMRLLGDVTRYTFAPVENPLHAHEGVA
ncbi:MAG TPA: IucA/IucC family protein [Pantanalinema sp.]